MTDDPGPKYRRKDLILPDLSYQVVGILYDVYNDIGFGHLEKIYQRAIAHAFRQRGISFKEQVPYEISYRGESVGHIFLDFLVNDELVLEIKQGDRFRKQNIIQVLSYLKASRP